MREGQAGSLLYPLLRLMLRGTLLGLTCGALLIAPRSARACGPCSTPELLGLRELAGQHVLVTNFGLLHQTNDGWRLTCEERLGGLLLDVAGDSSTSLVSVYPLGVFRQSGDLCDWSAGPSIVANDWALSFALARVTFAEATQAFALVVDADTQELHLERSALEEDFAIVHTFDKESGYRRLVAGGEPAHVFVGGYTFDPRTYNLAFSEDAGNSWTFTAPNVDNDNATMVLDRVDPAAPHAVFAHAEKANGEGDQLWRLDALLEEATALLELDPGETFQGIALSDEHAWVAAHHPSGGRLYRADRSDLVFHRLLNSGPTFGCLDHFGGALYACVNDFTVGSPFVLGRSPDQGQSWVPVLTLADLGRVTGCGDECSRSIEWLQGVLGSAGSGGNAGIGGSAGADNAGPSASDAAGAGADPADVSAAGAAGTKGGGPQNPSSPASSGCGCSTAAPRTSGAACALVLLAVAALRRKRLRGTMRAVGIAAAGLSGGSVLGCSNSSSAEPRATPSSAGAAGVWSASQRCGGRGDELRELRLTNENGLGLRFLEIHPDPPVVGDNSWLIEVKNERGEAVSGVANQLVITPFMPEHGHGTPVIVGVEEETAGRYRLAPVNTFMPGLWRIDLQLATHSGTSLFEFRVCVE